MRIYARSGLTWHCGSVAPQQSFAHVRSGISPCPLPWPPPGALTRLKNTLFRLCGAKVVIVETNETKRGSGRSAAPKCGA